MTNFRMLDPRLEWFGALDAFFWHLFGDFSDEKCPLTEADQIEAAAYWHEYLMGEIGPRRMENDE